MAFPRSDHNLIEQRSTNCRNLRRGHEWLLLPATLGYPRGYAARRRFEVIHRKRFSGDRV